VHLRDQAIPGANQSTVVYIIESLGFEMWRSHQVLVTYPKS